MEAKKIQERLAELETQNCSFRELHAKKKMLQKTN
jgi:hypothetical protein